MTTYWSETLKRRVTVPDNDTDAGAWLDERGFDDGRKWDGVQEALRADSIGFGGPLNPCRWHLGNGDGESAEFAGYVWPDGSGVYLTDGYWGTVPSSQAMVRGPV